MCIVMLLLFIVMESWNLDEVFTYNHIALMYLRSRYRVKASVVLMNADNLCIHNYIVSLLNITLRPILMVRTGLEHASYFLFLYCLSKLIHTDSYI